MDLQAWLLVAILAWLVLARLGGSANDSARLAAIDRKLNLILQNLGLDAHAGLDDQVRSLVQQGRKIDAIKLYREQTGVGLKEAKEYVDGV